jgi:hypothetical protein
MTGKFLRRQRGLSGGAPVLPLYEAARLAGYVACKGGVQGTEKAIPLDGTQKSGGNGMNNPTRSRVKLARSGKNPAPCPDAVQNGIFLIHKERRRKIMIRFIIMDIWMDLTFLE